MAKPSDLKILLESSLNEIFKATVSDILESVDRALSEYQGTIQKLESDNKDLKRLLFAQSSAETGLKGTIMPKLSKIVMDNRGCLSRLCIFLP